MDEQNGALDRRNYLKLTGAAGATAMVGLAGCLEDEEDPESDDGDGGMGDDDTDGDADGDADGGDTQDVQEIVAGTASGFPPFEMVEDGELVGFDVDLLEAVVGEADGYELTDWQDLDFESLIPALNDGSIDVIAAAMTITEDRQEQISFTDPYYSADQSVLVQEGGDFQPESIEDLEGTTVGAQTGTTGEGVVEDELIEPGLIDEGDYTSYDSYVLAVEDLERGLVEAVVLDQPVAQTFEADRQVEVAFTFETGEEYGFGVRQDDNDLEQALSEGVQAVQESSEYDDITEEWFAE